MQSTQGGKIRLYQNLYSQYSRLEFSHHIDRPVAIAGLEKRLISSLGLRGGFGVLDDTGPGLLRRSLLWRRARDEKTLDLIRFSDCTSMAPPTWSWMAYEGAIEYLDPPFNQVDWETRDIISPWASESPGTWSYSRDSSTEPRALKVIVRDFDTAAAATDQAANIIIDTPSLIQSRRAKLKCVVLGRLKDGSREALGDRRHFVMLVKPMGSGASPTTFLRAGVGFIPARVIRFDEKDVVGQVR